MEFAEDYPSRDRRDEFRAESDGHSRGSSSGTESGGHFRGSSSRTESAGHATFSSSPTITSSLPNPPTSLSKISDGLYELKAQTTYPSHEIVFFHGFELGDSSEFYWKDWLSADGSHCWLDTWLVERFPEARILLVSYDSSLFQTSSNGQMDLYRIAENIMSDLIMLAKVGQRNCPVVLVGHSVGGLVMKELVVQAGRSCDLEATNFLRSVRGFFFYATPHGGTLFVDKFVESLTGRLKQSMEVFENETGRLNKDFCAFVSKYHWKLFGLGEKNETKLGNFCDVLVRESSARQYMDNFYTIDADHFEICKPSNKNASSLQYLSTFITQVARTSVHTCPALPDHLMEIKSRVDEVEEIMKRAQVVGILGMGGIGKTTLAKVLFNDISVRYGFTCFIPNVKDLKLAQLEGEILGNFYQHGKKVSKAEISWDDVRKKKTLIVMDDVDSVDQMKVLPNTEWFGSGTHIIVTSRNRNVLLDKYKDKWEEYNVELMETKTAKKLFCWHAFGNEEVPRLLEIPETVLEDYVSAIIKECSGLPLTIEVIGCLVRRKVTNSEFWEETIKCLATAGSNYDNEEKLWAKLRVSYDALVEDEKDMFLEIATYFSGETLSFSKAYWDYTTGNFWSRWGSLKDRFLVKEIDSFTVDFRSWWFTGNFRSGWEDCKVLAKEIDGVQGKTVWMHDQLKALGRRIATETGLMLSNYGGSRDEAMRLLRTGDLVENAKLFNLEKGNVETKIIMVSGMNILPEKLATFRQLRILDLQNVETSSGEVPVNLSFTLTLLRWSWNGFRDRQLHFPLGTEGLENLIGLHVRGMHLEKSFIEKLGSLRNLRNLSLKSSESFCALPEDFGQLSKLQTFRMSLAMDGVLKLPLSCGKLSALEDICIDNMKVSIDIPSTLRSLRSLQIKFCEGRVRLPDSLGDLSNLIELHISGVRDSGLILDNLPESLGKLSKLETLDVSSTRLTSLPESLGKLSKLERLIVYSTRLTSLPESLGNLSQLKTLYAGCTDLTSLPESLGNLSQLETLDVSYTRLTSLPKSLGNLSQLKTLHAHCTYLTSLPESLGKLSKLKELYVYQTHLTSLPESLGNLSQLERLDVFETHLTSLPESLGNLSKLEIVDVSYTRLTSLPESLYKFVEVQDN